MPHPPKADGAGYRRRKSPAARKRYQARRNCQQRHLAHRPRGHRCPRTTGAGGQPVQPCGCGSRRFVRGTAYAVSTSVTTPERMRVYESRARPPVLWITYSPVQGCLWSGVAPIQRGSSGGSHNIYLPRCLIMMSSIICSSSRVKPEQRARRVLHIPVGDDLAGSRAILMTRAMRCTPPVNSTTAALSLPLAFIKRKKCAVRRTFRASIRLTSHRLAGRHTGCRRVLTPDALLLTGAVFCNVSRHLTTPPVTGWQSDRQGAPSAARLTHSSHFTTSLTYGQLDRARHWLRQRLRGIADMQCAVDLL